MRTDGVPVQRIVKIILALEVWPNHEKVNLLLKAKAECYASMVYVWVMTPMLPIRFFNSLCVFMDIVIEN